MAFNGTGTFARIHSWVSDKANSIKILASRMDSEMDGFATGLSTCVTKDGQTTTTARVPFAQGVSLSGTSTLNPSGSFNVTTNGGTASRNLPVKLAEILSVKDFGATGDGTTDDTTNVQAAATAAAAAGRTLFFPAGNYRLTNTITVVVSLWQGEGAGKSIITFDNFTGKNGITFTAASVVGSTGGLIGLELVAKTSNGLTCVEMPKTASQYSTYFTKWIFRDLTCRGFTRNVAGYSFAWDYGFAKWFRLSDCDGLVFSNVVIQGVFDMQLDPSGQLADCGIELDASSALLTARISDITFGPIHTGINIVDNAFFSITEFDVPGDLRGRLRVVR
jgi:hypothetical protein